LPAAIECVEKEPAAMDAGTRAAGGWRIELLGGLRAVRGDRVVTHFQTQQTGALLAYLAFYSQRSHPREVLTELLWPESDPQASRQRLRQALSALRQQFESPNEPPNPVIMADRTVVQLNPALCVTDVNEFDAALHAAAQTSNAAEQARQLTEAVDLYRGELLPGYFGDWVLREREWLAERYFRALGQLLEHLEREGDLERALQYARQGVRTDPLREEAQRDLMRLYAAAGQPDAALRQYRELERVLRELAATPDEATRSLVRDLERQSPAGSVSSTIHYPPQKDLAPARGLRTPDAVSEASAAAGSRIVILSMRHAEPDEQVLRMLEERLTAHGCQVLVDRHLPEGVAAARELEHQIRTADVVIPLLFPASIESEMLAYEVEIAHEAAQQQGGRPRLLPVRIADIGPLPAPLAAILDPLACRHWEGPRDDERVAAELLRAVRDPAPDGAMSEGADVRSSCHPAISRSESVVGVVPLDSPFYVVRRTDGEFRDAIARRESIVLVKGARQMGKTSLLARGLQQAREAGARVVLTDCQTLNAAHFQTVEHFLIALAQSLAAELELDVWPQEVWDAERGPNLNFELYLRRQVLGRIEGAVVWGLDEVDRLFPCDFGSEVFGLFRSWHNRRHLDPSSSWSRLTLAMAYATEAHLFITDLNQSPFNVGTRLELDDFTREQVADLNHRYQSPLRGEAETDRFYGLVGGQPYLVRRGLHEMCTRGIDIGALEAQADRDQGIYGDHLRRILALLARSPDLCEAVARRAGRTAMPIGGELLSPACGGGAGRGGSGRRWAALPTVRAASVVRRRNPYGEDILDIRGMLDLPDAGLLFCNREDTD
jgi:DNA-binding SARP family transcriptional activator